MKAIHYLSILVIAAMFASCSKGDTGDPGPQGPQGATGNANVFTQEYSVTSWSYASTDTWISTWSESDITDNNADAVEVYWSNQSSGWLAMPITSLIVTGDELSYGFDDGSITFSYYGNPNPPTDYSGFTTIYFKVTVIPPAIQIKYPGTNWNNAMEVAKIPEVHAALVGHK